MFREKLGASLTRVLCIFVNMKRVFFAICFLIVLNSTAQEFKGVLTVGLNASQIDGDGLSGFHKSGLMLGAGVAWQFHEKLSVNMSLEFMEKGSRTAFKDSLNLFKWKMQYIDIPVAISIRFHERFFAQLGLTPSVLLNDKVDSGLGYVSSNPQNDRFHLLGAVGIEFLLHEKLSLLMRYQYSLMRFNKEVSNTTPKYHNIISIGLRLYLENKKK